ncbi:terminase TerL endonuclease subunit [Vreelandella lionensis]|uniref:terminase TerL endonuclease subunit n=1 Tax=Vreelandella lionensis TaxID=1144478 RepID=UPI0009F74918|nr:terminase TerL endonuclease subunit [Halomonas lionensis]
MNLLRRLYFVVRATRAGQGEALDRALSDLQQCTQLSQVPTPYPLWMPAQSWKNAASILNVAPPVAKWAAICTGRQAPVSAVKLTKTASDRYEVLFYQTESADELATFLKGAGPIAYDPWRDTTTAMVLSGVGLSVAPFRCTVANISPAMQAARQWVCEGQLFHSGDAVLTQHVLQVLDKGSPPSSPLTQHYPSRSPGQRIDGALALIMAVGLALKEGQP